MEPVSVAEVEPVLDDCLDGLEGRVGFTSWASSALGSSTAAAGTLSETLPLTTSRSRLLSFELLFVCENMRLRRVVNVGFFCGVGRDGRSIESRASPFVCGTSSADVGAALVELLRELTDVDDGVGVGEVLALGVALGRALVSVDAAAGDDSDTAAAMVAQSSVVDLQSSCRCITSGSWQIWAEMRFQRAGRRPDCGVSKPNKMAVAGPVARG